MKRYSVAALLFLSPVSPVVAGWGPSRIRRPTAWSGSPTALDRKPTRSGGLCLIARTQGGSNCQTAIVENETCAALDDDDNGWASAWASDPSDA